MNKDLSRVTRLEVIDDAGRALVMWGTSVYVDLQDGGRTMKVFAKGLANTHYRDNNAEWEG